MVRTVRFSIVLKGNANLNVRKNVKRSSINKAQSTLAEGSRVTGGGSLVHVLYFEVLPQRYYFWCAVTYNGR